MRKSKKLTKVVLVCFTQVSAEPAFKPCSVYIHKANGEAFNVNTGPKKDMEIWVEKFADFLGLPFKTLDA